MTTSIPRLVLALLALAARPLAAAETPDAHAKGTMHSIVLEGPDVHPTTTKMAHGDTISFVNISTSPIRVTFTEPADLAKHIRCGLVRGKADDAQEAPWALFAWQDDKLVANVPPGQFASVCSLEPGRYTFTTEPLGRGPGGANERSGTLPSKAQIQVQ